MNVCVKPEEIPAFFMIFFFINHKSTLLYSRFNRNFVTSKWFILPGELTDLKSEFYTSKNAGLTGIPTI